MISRRLAIFGALFGLASAAQAQTRSATELPKCDYPNGMKLPSGGEVMNPSWSRTKKEYGQFIFGEFYLIYKPTDNVAEGYVFEVNNDGSPQLCNLRVQFNEALRNGWGPADKASEVKLLSSFLPDRDGLSLNNLSGNSQVTAEGVVLSNVFLRIVMAGPCDIVVEGPTRPEGQPKVPGFQHRLTSYDIVRRDARTVARHFMEAAAEEQRGICKGGGFLEDWSCFLTTATVDTFGLADDCWELTTLRRLRDGPMQARADWGQLAQSYNTIAPPIVAAINARPDAPKVWAQTYFTGILPAAIMVQLGLNKLAVWFYKNRVKALMRFTATA